MLQFNALLKPFTANIFKKILTLFIAFLVMGIVQGQVNVTVDNPTNSTPNLAASYASLASAVTALSGITSISGPITLTCDAGTEDAPAGGYVINFVAATTATNKVVITGAAGVTITAPTQTVASVNDAIIKIIGSDWVTIQGFTLQEGAGAVNTPAASNNMTEFGIALFYATTTNGPQNCTILNNTITLNKIYANTFAIYANVMHSSTVMTTAATATTSAGGLHGLKIYGNTISNTNNGIVINGPTAQADVNDGIDVGGVSAVTGNSITNYGTTGTFLTGYSGVSGTIYGVNVRNGKNVNVSYNTIQTATGFNAPASGTPRAIYIQAPSTIPVTGTHTNTTNNNTISIAHRLTTATPQAIFHESGSAGVSGTVNINNNQIDSIYHFVASPTGAITVLNVTGSVTNGPLNVNINSNVFGTAAGVMTSPSTGTFTFISNSFTRPANGVTTVNSNSIAHSFNRTGATGTLFGYNNSTTSPTTAQESHTSNNFSNITVAGTTTLTLWQATDGSTTSPFGPGKTITNNTFNNITGGTGSMTILIVGFSNAALSTNNVSGNTISNINGGGTITAYNSAGGAQNFFSNTIFGVTGSGASSTVSGMTIAGATSNQNIYKNKIYDLTSNGASGLVNGITVSSGLTTNIYNNLIGNLLAPSSSTNESIKGINLTSSTTSSQINVYYNTVYINATSVGANFGTSGISHTASATSTTAALNLRNNIIFNTSTAAGTGVTAAYRRSATNLANYTSTSNNNLFYAGSPSSTNLLFVEGTATLTNPQETIATLKSYIASGRDGASVSEDPLFTSTTGSDATFLKYNTASPLQLENGAANIATFTTDFDGTIRFGNPGSASTGTAPDMGAWELEGIGADFTPPVINYTALANTGCTTDRTFTANITDGTGVQTTAGTKPRLYYKKSGDANAVVGNTSVDNGWKYVESTSSSSPFSFTFNYGLLQSAVVVTDVIQYFVVAQDVLGTPNVSVNAGTFGSTPTSVNILTAELPTGFSSFTITAVGLSGTINVGAAETYKSLTEAGALGLFNEINTIGLSGNTTINLMDASITETGATALNAIVAGGCSAGPFTLTIKPNATTTLTGSSATSLIKLNGADYVTIDGSNNGSSSKDLTIQNTSIAANTSVIWVASLGTGLGSTNNTIKNCNIQAGNIGAAANTFGIYAGGATITTSGTGDDNDNLTIDNNTISKAYYGIYAQASAAGVNNNLTITSNSIGSVTATDYITFRGLLVSQATNAIVRQNTVFNIISSESQILRGMEFGSGVTSSEISRNNINTIQNTTTSGFRSGQGISVNTTNPANVTIANNVISGLLGHGSGTITNNAHGIQILGGGGYNVYFNSINLSGTFTTSASTDLTSALYIAASVTNVNLQNNVLTSTIIPSNQAAGKTYGIYCLSANTAFLTINNNDYFVSGSRGVLGFLGSDRVDLPGIQAGFGQNVNSYVVDPMFTSSTNLQINAGMTPIGLESGGATIPSVTTDFAGNTRPLAGANGGGTAPDIGAYEFDGVPLSACVTPSAQPTLLVVNATGLTTVAGSFTLASPASTGYLVLRTTLNVAPSPIDGTTYTVGNSVPLGAWVELASNATSFTSTGLAGGTQYYYWVYAYNSGTCLGGPKYLTVSPLAGNATTGALFTSITSGAWDDGATWNQAGATPSGSSEVVIAAAHNVTSNSNSAAGLLTINSTGSLEVQSNTLTIGNTIANTGTLTVSGGVLNVTGAATTGVVNNAGGSLVVSGGTMTIGVGGFNRRLTSSGTLTVSSGTLNINGNMEVTIGTFNQSGGTINVDGNNEGVNDVASGTVLVTFGSGVANNGVVSGGSLNIIDPPFTGSALSLGLNFTSGTWQWSPSHITTFGDGMSTNTSTNTTGFQINTYVGSASTQSMIGSLVINGGSATNRFATSASSSADGTYLKGNLTINAGSELRDAASAGTLLINGNIINEGTLTRQSPLVFGDYLTTTVVASTNAQTVSGAGEFRNLLASPTAQFTNLTVNNTNVSGVTFAAGLIPSVSAGLTVTAGNLNADTLRFVGGSAQAIALTAANSLINVINLTTNKSAGTATLSGSGRVNVTGALNITAGTLATAGLLTLKSTATNTARVTNVLGTISGNVNVERYLPANRSWRFLTAPVTLASPTTLTNTWQTIVDIVGPSGTGLSSTKPGYNFLTYNTATDNWTEVSDPTAVTLMGSGVSASNKAFGAFIPGPSGTLFTDSAATTLSSTGRLQTGTQAFVTTATIGQYALIGNPYASPVDLDLVYAANIAGINPTLYTWDPRLGNGAGTGAYIAWNWDGATLLPTPATVQTKILQSGQAFFVQALTATPTVTIEEAHKAATNNNDVFGAGNSLTDRLAINLQKIATTSFATIDGVAASFGSGYSKAVSFSEDAEKLWNNEENISIKRGSFNLIIEKRPYATQADTIFLNITSARINTNYNLNFSPSNWDAGSNAYLIDKVLNIETLISLNGNFNHQFTSLVTNVGDRFMVVFRGGTLPNRGFTVGAEKVGTNAVKVNWEVQAETGVKHYELQKSADGVTFVTVNTQDGKNGNLTNVYNYTDNSPVIGMNYYRVKTTQLNDIERYSNIVTINFKNQSSNQVNVFPNPVKGNILTLQLNDLEKGIVKTRLMDMTGKQLEVQQFTYNGGSAAQTITLSKVYASGTYQLQVEVKNFKKVITVIISNN